MLFFVLNNKKLPSHMTQISEHITYSNNNIHSYDQMSKMIVKLCSKKSKNNDKYSPQLNRLHNSIPMSIVDTPEKERKLLHLPVDWFQPKISTLTPCALFYDKNIYFFQKLNISVHTSLVCLRNGLILIKFVFIVHSQKMGPFPLKREKPC